MKTFDLACVYFGVEYYTYNHGVIFDNLKYIEDCLNKKLDDEKPRVKDFVLNCLAQSGTKNINNILIGNVDNTIDEAIKLYDYLINNLDNEINKIEKEIKLIDDKELKDENKNSKKSN